MSSRFVKEFNRLIKSIDKKFCSQANIRDYDADNMNCFIVELAPNNGPYKHGKFLFQIHASDHYPDSAPDVVCLTDIYHPNIDADLTLEHNICLNLFDEWNRTFGIEDCLQGLLFLLYHPNISDPVSSYFESGLDHATFIQNVGRSLRGEEVDGFTFQKNHGWAEFEAAQAAAAAQSVDLASTGAAATSDGNEVDAAAALVTVKAATGAPLTLEPPAAIAVGRDVIAPTSTEEIMTKALADCRMAAELQAEQSDNAMAATSELDINLTVIPVESRLMAEASNESSAAVASIKDANSDLIVNASDNDASNLVEASDVPTDGRISVENRRHSFDERIIWMGAVDGQQAAAADSSSWASETLPAPVTPALPALVDSGRPDSPDSLSLASDCLQDLLMQMQFGEVLDGDDVDNSAALPRDFVCRRFRAAPDTSDDDDDEDSSDFEFDDDDDDDDEEDDDEVDDGELVASVSHLEGLSAPFAIRSENGRRYRRRPDAAAVAASAAAAAAAASRRSLTVVARSSAPVVVRLRGGGMRSVQLLQVDASSRYPGLLSISLNGQLLQPSLARLLMRQAAQAYAESGNIWLGDGASPMTAGGGVDVASLLVCLLARHFLLPCLL